MQSLRMKNRASAALIAVFAGSTVGCTAGPGLGEATTDLDQAAAVEDVPVEVNAWEVDHFDQLSTGPLHGQSGWSGIPSATVVRTSNTNQELLIDPPAGSGQTIVMAKDVPDQASGKHRLEMRIRVDGVVNASVAKLEIDNGATSGWNKLFQIFAGTGLRLNYDPSGASLGLVGTLVQGQMYALRVDFDLGSGHFDAFVNGAAVGGGTMSQTNRRIATLGLSGWDLPGSVTFDDIVGQSIPSAPLPTVHITSPVNRATVSGTVPVTADATGSIARVDFLVDGLVIGSDATPPYSLAWDTRANPLPAPNHAMDFGYYYVEWKNPATFAARRAETNPYTNTYYAARSTYVSDDPNWPLLLQQSLATAVAEGRRIHLGLDLGPGGTWQTMIDVARPFWSSVVRVELADEPAWTLAETNQMIAQVDSFLASRGLGRPPGGYGIVYLYNQPIPAGASAPGLTWVGVEAYIDPPGSGNSQVDIQNLRARVGAQLAQVPAGKSIVLVPMAYDRNGAWPNIDTLRDLQAPMYLLAFNDPRVVAINMFSYTRAGGSFDHPELRTPHRMMAERIFARPIRGATEGPHSLRVRAVATDGAEATEAIVVTVANAAFDTK